MCKLYYVFYTYYVTFKSYLKKISYYSNITRKFVLSPVYLGYITFETKLLPLLIIYTYLLVRVDSADQWWYHQFVMITN